MSRHSYPYPFAPEEEPGHPNFAWVIVILLIVLVAVVVYLAPGLRAPLMPATLPELSLSSNPELAIFQQYQETVHAQSAAVFAARYPELGLVERYQTQQEQERAAPYLEQNPELRAFFAYTVGSGHTDSAFLAQNPEVSVYRRYQSEMR